jgi:hypothetical protein
MRSKWGPEWFLHVKAAVFVEVHLGILCFADRPETAKTLTMRYRHISDINLKLFYRWKRRTCLLIDSGNLKGWRAPSSSRPLMPGIKDGSADQVVNGE